jgi:hypothetical protein
MPAGSTYTPIATTTLGSSATSYTFSSIAGTYTDLYLVAFVKTDDSSRAFTFQVNGDTGSNYSWTNLIGNGSAASSGRGSSSTNINLSAGAQTGYDSNGGLYLMNFQNYSNTTTNKTVVVRNAYAAGFASATVGLWRSTSAITSITMTSGANMLAGCTFTLYGIASA